MKAPAIILALAAALALGTTTPANAQELRRCEDGSTCHDGAHWRWHPTQQVVEERRVTIPAHFETRDEVVTEPGRWEVRAKQVWRPPVTVYETRTRSIPARMVIGSKGVRWEPARTLIEQVPVQRPGYYETVSERVWVPPTSKTVKTQVWVPEKIECRPVMVEKPGYWEQTGKCTCAIELRFRKGKVRLKVD